MPAKKKTTKKKAPSGKVNINVDLENVDKCFTKGKKDKCSCSTSAGCGGAVYGLGFIGAAVYYIATATGFWMGVWGVIKAIVWPAFLVYKLFAFLML